MFLKNGNFSSKIKRSKVTDYATLTKLAKISKTPLVFYLFIITSRYFFSKFSVKLRKNLEILFSREPDLFEQGLVFCKDMKLLENMTRYERNLKLYKSLFCKKLRQRAFFFSQAQFQFLTCILVTSVLLSRYKPC